MSSRLFRRVDRFGEAHWGGPVWAAAVGLILTVATSSLIAADPGKEAKAAKSADLIARLSRVGDGYSNLRDEFKRLDTRIAETRMKLAQSELMIANGTRAGALLNDQIVQLQQASQVNNPERRNAAGANNRNTQSQNQIMALQNQFLQVSAQVRQERIRHNELTGEVNRSIQQQLLVRQKGYVQQDEYWRLADPFGRLPTSRQQAMLAELNEHLELDPDNPGALLVRGVVHRRLGEVVQAEADFTRMAAQEGPLQSVAYAARGELYYAQGKEKEGKADLGKATSLTKKKSDPRVLLYRGWILCGRGRFDLAEVELNKALRLGGGVDVDANRLLALTAVYYDGAGKAPVSIDEGLALAKRAHESSKGDDWLVLEALAAVQFLADEKSTAVETAKKAVDHAPEELRKRCEERLSFYEAGEKPVVAWPDPFRLELPKL